jgi:hypothetical protein
MDMGCAGGLGVFTALATLLAHQFWTLDGIERFRELNTFLEHLAIVAGFVLVAMIEVVRDSGRHAPISCADCHRRVCLKAPYHGGRDAERTGVLGVYR